MKPFTLCGRTKSAGKIPLILGAKSCRSANEKAGRTTTRIF